MIDAVSNNTAVSTAAKTQTQTAATQEIDFSAILAETLEKELQEKSVMMTAPSGGSSSSSSGLSMSGGSMSVDSSLQQMLLSAAATGQVGDAEIALFMLCTMMQDMEGGEFAPMMTAMASLLPQIQDGTSSATQSPTQSLKQALEESDYAADVKARVSEAVFYGQNAQSRLSGGAAATLPTQAWVPATPAVTNGAGDRSPEKLRAVIDQFQVETAERYRPYKNGGDTYCNIFVWDVTAALGCEIPHYVDAETGAPRTYPDVSGARELGATATLKWLETTGADYGWREVSAEQAQAYANAGYPAVTAGSGHVSMVCPSESGGYDSLRGPTVAQAGGKNYNYAHLSSTYNTTQRQTVRYFVHA